MIRLSINDTPCESEAVTFATTAFTYSPREKERVVAAHGFWVKLPYAMLPPDVDITKKVRVQIVTEGQQLTVEDADVRILGDGMAFIHTTHGRPSRWIDAEKEVQ